MYSYGKTRFYHFHYLFDDNENDIANEASIAPKIKAGGKKHHKFNEPIEKKFRITWHVVHIKANTHCLCQQLK